MTKEQRSRNGNTVEIKKNNSILYCLYYNCNRYVEHALGALGSYKTGLVFIAGVFIIFIGILIWTYFYENKFSSYCEKKGL